MDIFAGLDVGYRDPTAFCVLAFDWDTQRYYLLAEYLEAERTTEQHAEKISALIAQYDIDVIYIDSAAQQMRWDLAQDYGISTVNATKDVLAGISSVATIIDNNKLRVEQTCAHSLMSMDQYQWDPNRNLLKEKPVHNSASHMADALRYALYTFVAAYITV